MTTRDFLKKTVAATLAAALVAPHGAAAALAAEAPAPEAAAKPADNAAPAEVSAVPAASAPIVFSGLEIFEDRVAVKLSASVLYKSFLVQGPPRLVMDLLDTRNVSRVRSIDGKGKILARVRSSQFSREPRMITRIVLDLNQAAGYKVDVGSEGLTIQLAGSVGEEASASPAPAPSAPAAAASEPVEAAASVPAPASVPETTPAAAPASALEITPAAAPAPAPVVAAVPAPPVAETPAVEADVSSDKPSRPKDLSAAAAFKRAGLEGKMLPELAAAVEAEDPTRTSIVIPADVGDETGGQRRLGGRISHDLLSRLPKDRVTLDFDNTDIRDVLKLLAAKARVNIIYGTDVTGSLTLHLSRVPFDEAFRSVLSMMQLTTNQVGDNVLRVITPAALTAQRTASSPITKVIPLNYAKAAEVKTTIDSVRTAEGRGGNSSVDVKTNSIIVTESLEGIAATENLIAQLDQRPRQVLIEAKLIEVNANNSFAYGIQWDVFGQERGSIGGKQGTTVIGSAAGLTGPTVSNPIDGSAPQTTISAGGGVGAAGRGTGVSLSADKIFGALTLGRVANNYLLNATLTAAASEGKAKVLSDPKITTLNNQAANINVTTQIPYVTSNVASTGVQTQSVSYVMTGIQMTVTPSINADGRILLQINPTVSQPSVTASGSTQTGAPAVDSRNAQTTVLVRDGETIVIGGLISDSMQDTISKVPLLGDIPILGWLFKKKTKSRVRNELLIFVTTRILPD